MILTCNPIEGKEIMKLMDTLQSKKVIQLPDKITDVLNTKNRYTFNGGSIVKNGAMLTINCDSKYAVQVSNFVQDHSKLIFTAISLF